LSDRFQENGRVRLQSQNADERRRAVCDGQRKLYRRPASGRSGRHRRRKGESKRHRGRAGDRSVPEDVQTHHRGNRRRREGDRSEIKTTGKGTARQSLFLPFLLSDNIIAADLLSGVLKSGIMKKEIGRGGRKD